MKIKAAASLKEGETFVKKKKKESRSIFSNNE